MWLRIRTTRIYLFSRSRTRAPARTVTRRGTHFSDRFLSGNLSGPTIFDRPPALPTEANFATAPSGAPSKLLHRIAMLRKQTDKKLISTQNRYENHHDRRICGTITFGLGQWVVADGSPIAVTATDQAVTNSYS